MTFVYVIFILLAIIGSVFFDRVEGYGRYKLLAYRCLYLLLIGIVGFSYGLGGDKFAYMDYFEYYYDELDNIWECVSYEFSHMGFMPLWTLLVLTIKSTTDSFYVLQIVLALLVNIPICEVVRKHTSHGFLFLLLFFISGLFFQFNTEAMREGPAIALGLIAIEHYMNGNKRGFWIWWVLALGFHLSALAVLLVPILMHFELTRKNIAILFGTTIVCWALSDMVLIPILSYFLAHDAGAIGSKFIIYTSVQTSFMGFLRSFLSMMVVPVFAIYFNRELEEDETEKYYRERMTNTLVFLAFIGCTFAGFTRFFNYVQVFYLMMLSELIYHLLETKLHFVFRVATAAFALVFWIWYQVGYWPNNDFYFYQFYVPYTSILEEDYDVYFRQDAYYEVCDYGFYDDRAASAE